MFRKFTSTALILALLAALISASPAAVGGKDQTRHDIILSHYPVERTRNLKTVFQITADNSINLQRDLVSFTISWTGNCLGESDSLTQNQRVYEYCKQLGCGNIKIAVTLVVNGQTITCGTNNGGGATGVPQKDFVIKFIAPDKCDIN